MRRETARQREREMQERLRAEAEARSERVVVFARLQAEHVQAIAMADAVAIVGVAGVAAVSYLVGRLLLDGRRR